MKRALVSLLASTLAFVCGCQTSQNDNGIANANANKNSNTNQSAIASVVPKDKIVQIFINDDPAKPGYYEIEDPGSVTLHKKKNQRIAWCVVYEGRTPPSDVVIDNFKSLSPKTGQTASTDSIASNPFGDGSPGDNTFDIPSADYNTCKRISKTPKANADLRSYKYMITVKVNGEDRGRLDPVVIIDN